MDYIKLYKKIHGIIYIGLTCYINSLVQVLIHTYSFLEYFINKIEIIVKNKISISYYFYKMVCNIYKNNNLKVIDINDFIIFFKDIHPAFGGINQFDSSEFLRVLLKILVLI